MRGQFETHCDCGYTNYIPFFLNEHGAMHLLS